MSKKGARNTLFMAFINGTLPSILVDKTLEIGVMHEDSSGLQSIYYKK